MRAQSTFSLKDQLFNADSVDYLATLLERVQPAFPGAAFRTTVTTAFPSLELKQRIAHITRVLHASLPARYRDALAIILAALPPELDPARSDGDYGDFVFAPLSLFVATYGCAAEHLDVSLDALRHITKRFSAEDAVRYFLNAFPAATLAFLRECAGDEHYHVRRLASEGTRPLLPWAQRLTIDYREPLPLLDLLFADRTRYVTRSVANHLNDVSKRDAELVLVTLARWRDRRVGDAFRFSFTVRAHSAQRLLLDYVMTFAGSGRDGGRKVFRLKQVELAAGESVTIVKAHPMRLMTTRRLHAGEHRITLQANGQPQGTLAFELVAG